MYKERGKSNGYDRLRIEQKREGVPKTEPRMFLGDILRFKHETANGYVVMVQINDYEERKRRYRIDFDFTNNIGSIASDSRNEAGEIYDRLREELVALD